MHTHAHTKPTYTHMCTHVHPEWLLKVAPTEASHPSELELWAAMNCPVWVLRTELWSSDELQVLLTLSLIYPGFTFPYSTMPRSGFTSSVLMCNCPNIPRWESHLFPSLTNPGCFDENASHTTKVWGVFPDTLVSSRDQCVHLYTTTLISGALEKTFMSESVSPPSCC